MKAIWNGEKIAESDETIKVEGNHYFPRKAVNMGFLVPSETETFCSWKGVASYYTIDIDGEINRDACWYYAEPKEAAEHIRGHLAFWRGVEVTS